MGLSIVEIKSIFSNILQLIFLRWYSDIDFSFEIGEHRFLNVLSLFFPKSRC